MMLGMVLRIGLALSTLVLLPFNPVRAEGNPDIARGIVAEYCSKCHDVPGYGKGSKDAAVIGPSFRSIANQPTVYTQARLKSFLNQPHYPMTKFILSPSDIDNLIAYIESLRRK
jgi:cytochrome c2